MRGAVLLCVSQPAQRHLDKRHARLHQPARQQTALTEAALAVGLAG